MFVTIPKFFGLSIATLPVLADIPPPSPTFVYDSLYLGLPEGIIVGLLLVIAAICLYIALYRRTGKRWLVIIAVVILYVGMNFGIYRYVFGNRANREHYVEERQTEQDENEKPTLSPRPAN